MLFYGKKESKMTDRQTDRQSNVVKIVITYEESVFEFLYYF